MTKKSGEMEEPYETPTDTGTERGSGHLDRLE